MRLTALPTRSCRRRRVALVAAREGRCRELTGPPYGSIEVLRPGAYFGLGELMSRSTPPCEPHALVLETQAPSLQ
jgi:hypothetical protein